MSPDLAVANEPTPPGSGLRHAAREWVVLRWLLALGLSGAVVFGATRGTLVASAEKASLPPARAWAGCATGAPNSPMGSAERVTRTSAPAGTLIIADDAGHLPISRVYATLAANLASHFGSVRVIGTSGYTRGMLGRYRGGIYLGVSSEQRLPVALRHDVRSGDTPVLWLGYNVEKLGTPGGFAAQYGWRWGSFVRQKITGIRYKGRLLSRDPQDTDPVRTVVPVDRRQASVLGEVVTAGGRARPWAVRSAGLLYVGEIPLDAATETDRYLAVADLMYDVLAPDTGTRHRALVRLEDIGPDADPKAVRAAGELLARMHVPFSFGVYPVYRGPLVPGRPQRQVRLKDRPEVARAIAALLKDGGTMVLHGYSHQSDGMANPSTGESGQDFEFFRTHWGPRHSLVYDGAMPGDSAVWAGERLDAALAELRAAHLPAPRMLEFPHYAASPADYAVAARTFAARYDRGQYFSPAWHGRSPASPYMYEQFAPYLLRDTYGSVVVPENLGFVTQPPPPHGEGSVEAIIAHARAELVVRDNVASFFYHPFLGTARLKQAVDGVRALGYRFVSPCTL
jgi:uncharacterized protein YdaL